MKTARKIEELEARIDDLVQKQADLEYDLWVLGLKVIREGPSGPSPPFCGLLGCDSRPLKSKTRPTTPPAPQAQIPLLH